MLAKIAGWEEEVTSLDPADAQNADVSIFMGADELRVHTSGFFDKGVINLYNLSGKAVETRIINGDYTIISTTSLSAGSYIVRVSKNNRSEARKVIVLE